MSKGREIRIWGTTLALFLLASYGLCILFGLLVPAGYEMHEAWAPLLPGFVWLTPGDILIGAAWVVFYAWYLAVGLVLLRRWVETRLG